MQNTPLRDEFEQAASKRLFGDCNYVPKNPSFLFIDTEAPRDISYTDLVEELRNAQ